MCETQPIAAMDTAGNSPSVGDVGSAGKQVLQSDLETPSSLTVSETTCGLKQAVPPPTSIATPIQQQHQREGVPSNGSPPQPMAPPTVVMVPIEVEGPCETGCDPTSLTVSAALTRVKKTREEREALRLERERVRAEAQALREEERLRKEEARLKKEREKKARRERKEQEERVRQERKEAKERERREKMEKKEMERLRKEEEDKKRREEKQRAEIEKQQSAEEKIRKQHKAQELFSSFFSKLPKTEAETNGKSRDEGRGAEFDVSLFDGTIQSQTPPSAPYLSQCQSHRLNSSKPRPMENDDVIIMSSPIVPPGLQMKLLQFHSNVRPAYFGSWRKRSRIISGRAPFRMDTSVLDYEFDSDDEWEEEEPGESVSSASEGEESGGEESGEEGEEDGFFVPHGYLSEDEGERSESEGGPAGSQMDKVKAKAKAWEAEFQRTCQPKKAVCIGCVWVGGEGGEGRGGYEEFLSQFSALVLTETPVGVEPATATPTFPSDTHGTSDNSKRRVPEEAMPDLIRLVHQSTAGLGKLVKTFQTHWGRVLHNRAVESGLEHSSPDGAWSQSPQAREGETENQSRIAKRQLEKRIQQIATKEVRPQSARQTWYVHESVLKQYKIETSQLTPYLPLTPKSTATTEKSCSPEAPLSTPVSKRATKRRGTGNTPTLFEVIAKSPQTTTSATTPAQKRLKLAPSLAGGAPGKTAVVGEGEPPPKKRIKLETLSLKSPLPVGEAGKGEEGHPVIDLSSDSIPVQPTTTTTTPSRKGPISLPLVISPSKRPPVTLPTNDKAHKVMLSSTARDNSQCLQEVTNSQRAVASTANTERGEENGENRPHVDWPKLLTATFNKVTVIADIH